MQNLASALNCKIAIAQYHFCAGQFIKTNHLISIYRDHLIARFKAYFQADLPGTMPYFNSELGI
ncbi:hypothetical protein GALL_474240 [mine drainage metagenome]|uniref:Uncharacterized protein n=1 Tax=mine drainage metagenome TaxID=410659 RepID=A0A1J5Q0E0_9ZZZZ